jgi:hypothetical protein
MAAADLPQGQQSLSPDEALSGAEISAGDIGRALVKWRRRVPNFLERLREAAGDADQRPPDQPA